MPLNDLANVLRRSVESAVVLSPFENVLTSDFSVCGDLRRLSKFLRCFDEVGGIYGSASRRPKQQGTENHPERNGRHSVSGFQLIPADSVIVHGAISRL